MKLRKSAKGRFFIILYYTVSGVVVFFLTVFLIIKVGFLIGLAAGLVMGIAGGVLGGELEYIDHVNTPRKKHPGRKRQDAQNKVIPFPTEGKTEN